MKMNNYAWRLLPQTKQRTGVRVLNRDGPASITDLENQVLYFPEHTKGFCCFLPH
jgi:hypothetical protein